jgi:hypothetical protein
MVCKLYLGDHGFLKQYGSKLDDNQIISRMVTALEGGIIGLAAGDVRCMTLAGMAIVESGFQAEILHHTDILMDNKNVSFERTMCTLNSVVSSISPEFSENDPVCGQYLASFEHSDEYVVSEVENLINQNGWFEEWVMQIQQLSIPPSTITLGGDYLELLIALGMKNQLTEMLRMYKGFCELMGIELFLTTYLGAYFIEQDELNIITDIVDGLMIPMNEFGHGMFPSKGRVVKWMEGRVREPVIAMHVLSTNGGDVVDIARKVESVFSMGASSVVIGASSREHIELLTKVNIGL